MQKLGILILVYVFLQFVFSHEAKADNTKINNLTNNRQVEILYPNDRPLDHNNDKKVQAFNIFDHKILDKEKLKLKNKKIEKVGGFIGEEKYEGVSLTWRELKRLRLVRNECRKLFNYDPSSTYCGKYDSIFPIDVDTELYKLIGEFVYRPRDKHWSTRDIDVTFHANEFRYGHEYLILGTCNLTSIKILGEFTEIMPYTFSYCKKLREIVLPDSLEHIGFFAFKGLPNLKKITIPPNVQCIDWGAFLHTDLEQVTMPIHLKDTFSLPSKTKVHYYVSSFRKNKEEIFDYGCAENRPDHIKSLENIEYRFCNTHIPEGTKIINEYEYSRCKNLRRLIIPKSVKKIKEGAFSFCKNLKSVKIPKSVEYIGDNAFLLDTSLSRVRIHESTTKVSNHSFFDCIKLRKFDYGLKDFYDDRYENYDIKYFEPYMTSLFYTDLNPRLKLKRLWYYIE